MKTLKIIVITIVALLVGLFIGRMWQGSENKTEGPAKALEPLNHPSTYTCSMHPQIQQSDPGDCPICGMELVPLESSSGISSGLPVLEMSESAQRRAAIETSLVEQRIPKKIIRLSGKLEYDETLERTIAARFPARIERLFVNFTGIKVSKGDHLAEIYSPELLTAQRELLAAHRRDPQSPIAQAAHEKLLLWGIQPEQINALYQGGAASDHFTLKAPIGGIVVSKQVRAGDYVKTGEELLGIMDVSRLWVMLDVSESDLPWLRYGQAVHFNIEAIPGETFSGRIAFIEPEINQKTRTVAARLSVNNSDGCLKSGMFVRGRVEVELAAGGAVLAPDLIGKWISPMHPEIIREDSGQCDVCGMDLVPAEILGYAEPGEGFVEAPLLVPASAVLQTGSRAVVYVQEKDSPVPLFEGREITLGPRAHEDFIVLAGLEKGERVVTKGAFKIDSALQIQARPSMMSMPSEAPAVILEAHELSEFVALLKPYLALQAALAADDFKTAGKALRSMMAITGHKGDTAALVHNMLSAKTIESLRRPHFENFSNAIITAVQTQPKAFGQRLYLKHCSMVYPERGADWLQGEAELLNPYFGATMLHCGNQKAVFE
jgi:Cu(I)/Ag(I) efflux system membrane fusion protein